MSQESIQLTLYSSSQKPYLLSNTTLAQCVYAIDWNAVFNGLNYKYRKAQVRCHLSGLTNIAKDTVSNATGYLSLVGLGSGYTYSQDIAGLVIGDLQYANSTQVSAAETGYYINMDTRDNVCAPMTPVPVGSTSNFIVQFTQENGSLMANANLSNYALTIVFTLFDEI
jgi:hypothetical protein